MATATQPAAIPQIDPKLEQAYARAQAEFNKVQSELQATERELASATAQFNEECKLQALGKSADPAKYRGVIDRFEQKIIGQRQIVAERQAEFNSAASERREAYAELSQESERQRFRDLRKTLKDAQDAVTAAWAAVRRAQEEERRAGNALSVALRGNPAAGNWK